MLVGGGHAHVQVLRRFAMDPPPDTRVLVVLDRPVAVYSGMVPGFVAGDYTRDELEIDVVPLARRAGAGVILSPATDLDPVRSELSLEGRPPIRFDVASLDVGSTVRGLDLPGVREHALSTRPIGHFVAAVDHHTQRLAMLTRPARIVVVGGGAAGSELAFTLDARLRKNGLDPAITVLTSDTQLLSGSSRRTRAALHRELEARGIEVRFGERVVRVEKDCLATVVSEGEEQPEVVHAADLVVWATGASPVAFPAHEGLSSLATDRHGFLEVRDTLQATGFDTVFAVGDCARLVDHRWVPRAGVYAVRQGPVLESNLRALLAGKPLRKYRPQRDFLSLLNLGFGRALGSKWGLTSASRSAFRVKDWIDRRFMARFQVLDENGLPRPALAKLGAMGGEDAEEAMRCGGCAAKLGAEPLALALSALPNPPADESVVLGLAARDDVAATRDETGRVTLHNIDAIRAFCDDPYLVGRVATSNALSDLFASGGRPTHAQAIIGLPETPAAEGQDLLFQILSGVRSILDPLGVSLLGGHTTIGDELTVGLSVSGTGPPEAALLAQSGTRRGDALLLCQPLGTGVVLAADMQGNARGEWVIAAHEAMQHINDVAGRIALEQAVHGATDVTGFGFAGHLLTMLSEGDLEAEIEATQVPFLPGARALWQAGHRSTAHPANEQAFEARVSGGSDFDRAWLFDPQTAGGLLLAVAEERVEALVNAFALASEPAPIRIGRVTDARAAKGLISVRP